MPLGPTNLQQSNCDCDKQQSLQRKLIELPFCLFCSGEYKRERGRWEVARAPAHGPKAGEGQAAVWEIVPIIALCLHAAGGAPAGHNTVYLCPETC